MITAAMIAYYLLAFGLLYTVAYFTYRQNSLRSRALVDKLIAELQEEFGKTPPLEPYVREPLPEPAPEEIASRLVVTIASVPNAPPEQAAALSARLFEALNKLAIANGGAGLKVDSLGRDVPALVPAGKGE